MFEAFRTNPVGDNLVSSAIVEMCDFIHTENIVSLIEHIVTKHLSATNAEAPVPSLEDVSSPYVSTLTVLRKAYEKNLKGGNKSQSADAQEQPQGGSDDAHSRYFHGNSVARTSRVVMNEKALEDQVRAGPAMFLEGSMFVFLAILTSQYVSAAEIPRGGRRRVVF